ncbi:hypothetical protein A1Q1_02609 [Trichosporon asahii var. asahii CBS 2479]|uniref:Uncharacterized protein n=1 Tax=Trichosporon asahii var. asahii (strain ATCC 90039 / CBS 2479 / JCM 2466 / KCTC 7840 / NBRC 103889/ NCYC 2677 / UAMH 7654) TaxID=1186058 RepID=J5SZ93_TRIAS|nr:hypothetical protein A1Q1_02609 [Trichosporon asahii var. asahii CBS 2479]EJT48326.1 hypothetical protein A1Q1_02609 [Trichosporon asahii var. asahii CBS 2479]
MLLSPVYTRPPLSRRALSIGTLSLTFAAPEIRQCKVPSARVSDVADRCVRANVAAAAVQPAVQGAAAAARASRGAAVPAPRLGADHDNVPPVTLVAVHGPVPARAARVRLDR